MNRVEWTPAMSVGSAELDGHHQMIFDCLNRLGPLIGQGDRDEEIRSVLSTLEEFVLVHFSEEERLISAAGYPDLAHHKHLHDRMYAIVFDLKADLEHGRLVDATRLYQLIYDWLTTHILGEDRKYIPYLEQPASGAKSWSRGSGRPY